jgi:hypothetical protein
VTTHAFTLDDVLVAMLSPDGVAEQLEQGHASRALCWAGLDHDDSAVRCLAAQQGVGFPDVLAASMQHGDVRVRMAVLEHPDTPDIVPVRVALDATADIRKELATRTKSPSAMELLGRDASMRVRVALARRMDHDDELTMRLATDPHPKVRAAIARSARPVAAQRALVNDPQHFVLIALVRNPNLTVDVTMALAQRPENVLRRGVARHTQHPEVLDALAHDPDREVRIGVAHNPSTTVATAATMVHDRSSYVRDIIAHRHGDTLTSCDSAEVTPLVLMRVASV